jgi:hypothetical protein
MPKRLFVTEQLGEPAGVEIFITPLSHSEGSERINTNEERLKRIEIVGAFG